jgi:hypothetical protein
VAAPEQVAERLLGKTGRRPEAQYLVRLFGIRDLVLGAGTLSALAGTGSSRQWLLAGAASDAVDLAATLAARDALPAQAASGTIAAASAALAVGLGAVARLD